MKTDELTTQVIRDAFRRGLIDRMTHDNATNAMLDGHPLRVAARHRVVAALAAERSRI